MTLAAGQAEEHAALAARVAHARDRDAFTRLFDFYAVRIHAYLLRMKADAATADEITQDVMVTLWRKAHLFDPAKSSLTTWLYRITRNRRIDLLRRQRVDYLDPFELALDHADDSRASAEDLLAAGQRDEILRRAMAQLPQEQLALVRLAFFDGLSHSEVAEATGLPLGTVKSRLRLAFGRLRRAVEAAGVLAAE